MSTFTRIVKCHFYLNFIGLFFLWSWLFMGNAEGAKSLQKQAEILHSEPTLIDLASPFLDQVCTAQTGDEFANAWLAYEERNWEIFEAFYYDSQPLSKERSALAQDLKLRQDEMCGYVRAFLVAAPGVIQTMRKRVETYYGTRPEATIYILAALQWTDGRSGEYRGEPTIVLNARHDSFSRVQGLAITVTHELIHDVQTRLYKEPMATLHPILRELFQEGGAVFGVQTLFPEIGHRALGLKPEEVSKAQSVENTAAAELLRLLSIQTGETELLRFFQGGWKDPIFPPKMGYVIGAKIFQALAKKQGLQTALRIHPQAFSEFARSYLSQVATTVTEFDD